VTVVIRDSAGNVVSVATNEVALTLTVPGGAVLSGGEAVAAVGGVATFADLRVDLAGTYTLTATSGGLASAVSVEFEVTAGPATP
jgi:hypothetical protein